ACIVPLDAYYRDLSALTLEERVRCNFDEPAAFDWPLLETHLDALARGQAIEMPAYDFAIHTRKPESVRVAPRRYIIVEGLLALWSEKLRAISTLRMYVDLDPSRCLSRREQRDVAERGRSVESVRKQFAQTVAPMAERYVAPTKRYADLIIRGDAPLRQSLHEVLERLNASPSTSSF
ncbi:MAG: uridine kinase, partial [Candidatus Hydrogenedentes bacterium]|nr:uridine kinase [Candidatus Hydrogenedentota bacterium]